MTWNMPIGCRVLSGDEASLFKYAIRSIAENLVEVETDEESWIVGAPSLYNRMTRTQQAASLIAATEALFLESDEPLPLSAWAESTLSAILFEIKNQIIIDLDQDGKSDIIQVISDKTGVEVRLDVSSGKDTGIDEAFESYEDRFLWDSDMLSLDLLAESTENAKRISDSMGYPEGYCSSICPDLENEQELDLLEETLNSILLPT